MDSYYFIPKEGPLHTTKAGIIHRKCQMIRTFLANINTRHGENIQGNFNVYQYEDVDAATRYGVKESVIIDNWKRKIIGSMPAELIQSHKDNKPQMDPQKQKGIQPTVQKIVRAFMVLHGMYPRYDFKGDKHKVVKIDWTDFTTQFEHDMEGLQPRFTVQMAASGVVGVTLFDRLYGILDEEMPTREVWMLVDTPETRPNKAAIYMRHFFFQDLSDQKMVVLTYCKVPGHMHSSI